MHAGDCDSLHLPLRWYGGCIIFDSVVGELVSSPHKNKSFSKRHTATLLYTSGRHYGRGVKAIDSKSIGVSPRGFKSHWCRLYAGSFRAMLRSSMESDVV